MTATKGLHVRIVMASFGTLVLLLVAFVVFFVEVTAPSVNRLIERMEVLHAEEAVVALRSGGEAALAAYLARVDRGIGGNHYLTDAKGRDVLTGTDRTDLFFGDRINRKGIGHQSGRISVAVPVSGGYRLLAVVPAPFRPRPFLPYYAAIFAGIVPLCWWLTASIGWPLRKLAATVDAFGRGDLEIRSGVRPDRRDEIGELARAFDGMAERVQTLLTAERQLLQDISHELRSPLARLNIAIELYRTSPNRDFSAGRLQREVDQLTRLVESLIEVTRAEGDPTSTPKDPVDLWPIVQETAERCAVEATSRGCELATRQLTTIGTIIGHTELLRRAFENVIRNAIRFAPQGSLVEVDVQGDATQAEVVVRDFGPGVPDNDLARLVTPFFRVDRARDSKTGGLGLGLAIAHRAVLLHHGSFVAENARPGLRVRMTFPSHAIPTSAGARSAAAV